METLEDKLKAALFTTTIGQSLRVTAIVFCRHFGWPEDLADDMTLAFTRGGEDGGTLVEELKTNFGWQVTSAHVEILNTFSKFYNWLIMAMEDTILYGEGERKTPNGYYENS